MPLDDLHLQYHQMRHGMDHSRYAFSRLAQRPNIHFEQGSLAVVVIVSVQSFPLNPKSAAFRAPGSMSTPYPDLRHASLRDYGNRVGVYRVIDALKARNIQAGFALNSDLLDSAPSLAHWCAMHGELIAHGTNMDALHVGGMDAELESEQIHECVRRLRKLDPKLSGWLSPAKSQSHLTPDLLHAHGLHYCLDWVNDELPYQQHTQTGPLWALPLSTELEDRFILQHNLHSEASYVQQLTDAATFLQREALETQCLRLITLNLHPWLIGQPHRIGALERALDAILALPGSFSMPPGEFVARFADKSRESGTANKSRESGTANKSRESGTANTPRESGTANTPRESGVANTPRESGTADKS